MKSTPSIVYAVIVTYNAESWIEKCLGSLKSCTIPVSIVVVDNDSSDQTVAIIKKRFPEVTMISQESNLGFGTANNIGIRHAYDQNANFVFLLNQDAWVVHDTIETLIEVSLQYPEFGILSPMHLNGSGEALDYNFQSFICKGHSERQFLSDLFVKGEKGLAPVYKASFVNAALWLLPRKTIELVGGFNPYFFLYGEDNEYANRVHYHKLYIGFVPRAIGYHGRPQVDQPNKQAILSRRLTEVELLNPIGRLTVSYLTKVLFKKAIIAGIRFQWNEARQQFNQFFYFRQRKASIESSLKRIKENRMCFLD